MKRCFALIFALLLIFCTAASETQENPFACDCEKEVCECFLQEGDIGPAAEGVIVYLKERGYLAQMHSRGVFDEEVTLAVKAFQKEMDLDETGVLDNETLTMLIFYGMPESMYLWNEKAQALLWVPSDGGVCKHTDPQCSGILNPRKISAMNAEALMLDACDHCMPEAAEEMYE